jgi:hypothetical protein
LLGLEIFDPAANSGIGVGQIYGVATQTDVKRDGTGLKWAIQS